MTREAKRKEWRNTEEKRSWGVRPAYTSLPTTLIVL
jgi:hypothetical protein